MWDDLETLYDTDARHASPVILEPIYGDETEAPRTPPDGNPEAPTDAMQKEFDADEIVC